MQISLCDQLGYIQHLRYLLRQPRSPPLVMTGRRDHFRNARMVLQLWLWRSCYQRTADRNVGMELLIWPWRSCIEVDKYQVIFTVTEILVYFDFWLSSCRIYLEFW